MHRLEALLAVLTLLCACVCISGYLVTDYMLRFGRDWRDDFPEVFVKRLNKDQEGCVIAGSIFVVITVVLVMLHG